jgi:hypothetical protein
MLIQNLRKYPHCARAVYMRLQNLCLRKDLFDRLGHFYNRCLRSMSRIAITHSLRYHISSVGLFTRQPIDFYNSPPHCLNGNDARMPFTKEPLGLSSRQSPSSWMPKNYMGPHSQEGTLWIMSFQVNLSTGAGMRLIAIEAACNKKGIDDPRQKN